MRKTKSTSNISNPRIAAAKIVFLVSSKKQSLSSIFSDRANELSPRDKALTQELSYGTIRHYFLLKALLNELLHTPLKPGDADLECLLLVGIYQILFTRIPEYAAVSETVAATQNLGKSWAKGLFNKVLRRLITEKNQLLEKIQKKEEAFYSHPQWMIQLIQEHYPQNWKSILEANNSPGPLFLRVNSQKIERDEYLALLNEKNIPAQAVDDLDQAILLKNPLPVSQLPGFAEGFCSVQDASGQWIEPLLNILPHQRILDACAAPGSKFCHILERHPDLQTITAIDSDSERLLRLKENLNRLEISHEQVHLILANANHVKEWWDGQLYDRILLDAPCSSLGVIRRHPDIKLLRQKKDIEQMAKQQLHLLSSLWPLLTKNGLLLYSTCSILPEENAELIQAFLQQHKEATLIPLHLKHAENGRYGSQCLPSKEGPDGFFYALIQKN